MSLRLKRAYADADRDDGYRVLVDRLWPRGLSKEDAHIDAWLKALAPSGQLRKWFGHDRRKWAEFKKHYFEELEQQQDAVRDLAARAGQGAVTLLYGARDEQHNNAAALKEYLERRM